MFGDWSPESRRRAGVDARQLLYGQRTALELLAKGAPVRETLGEVARLAEACTPDMLASIMLYESESGCLRRGGHATPPDAFIDAVDGLVPGPASGSCGTAAWRRSRVITVDIRQDPLWTLNRELAASVGIRSVWSSPIISPCDGRLLGVFGMYSRDARAPAEEDLELVDHFVHLAAICMERQTTDHARQTVGSVDALTGLANRQLLESLAVAHCKRAMESGRPMSIAFLDLDRFSRYNESLGYVGTDQLLRDVCVRIASALRPGDTLARFGGDEFVLLVDGPIEEARCRVDCMRQLLEAPLVVARIPVRVSFACGIAQSSGSVPPRFEDLMREATVAAKAAKSLGLGRALEFDGSWHARVDRERFVARSLVQAVKACALGCELQPIIDLETGKTASFEVLARLIGVQGQDLSPAEFMPVAEERGLVHAIGMLMLRQACSFVQLQGGRRGPVMFNVNLSAHQLMRQDFVRDVMSWVRSMDVSPGNICFEVPDTALLDVGGLSESTLNLLKSEGFHLALDDFGAGHVSFVRLRKLPFDFVKLDRSFMARVPGDESTQALFRSMVAIATGLGMQVTVKGIETQEQLDFALESGRVLGQGGFWSMPLNPSTALFMWSEGRRQEPLDAEQQEPLA